MPVRDPIVLRPPLGSPLLIIKYRSIVRQITVRYKQTKTLQAELRNVQQRIFALQRHE